MFLVPLDSASSQEQRCETEGFVAWKRGCGGVREDRENSEAVICAGTRHGRRKGAGWFPCPSYSGPAVRNDAQLHFAIELVPEKDTRIEPHRSIDRNMPKPGKDVLGGGRNWNTAAVLVPAFSPYGTARNGSGIGNEEGTSPPRPGRAHAKQVCVPRLRAGPHHRRTRPSPAA
jgi:hypothetical protein